MAGACRLPSRSPRWRPGKLGNEWLALSRRYAMVAWVILGLGNMLGAWWAYHVLGWGGYWGWDPVENVALMPWLVGTAFIHSIQMQERRGMLKAWNIVLLMVDVLPEHFRHLRRAQRHPGVGPRLRAVGNRAILPDVPGSGDRRLAGAVLLAAAATARRQPARLAAVARSRAS